MKVVGLGTLCLTSQFLKQLGLKEASMPFDWIFSSPSMIAHAVQDDFQEFLRRDNLFSTTLERRPHPALHRGENTFYQDRFNARFMFNHHDPAAVEADYDYFARCVDRFRAVIHGERVLFLLFKHLGAEPAGQNAASYQNVATALNPHDVLCVEIDDRSATGPHFEVLSRSGSLDVRLFRTRERINGIDFGCAEDRQAMAEALQTRITELDPVQ